MHYKQRNCEKQSLHITQYTKHNMWAVAMRNTRNVKTSPENNSHLQQHNKKVKKIWCLFDDWLNSHMKICFLYTLINTKYEILITLCVHTTTRVHTGVGPHKQFHLWPSCVRIIHMISWYLYPLSAYHDTCINIPRYPVPQYHDTCTCYHNTMTSHTWHYHNTMISWRLIISTKHDTCITYDDTRINMP